jgi:hypothetical protein
MLVTGFKDRLLDLEAEAADLFFQLVSSRYERASLIVSSRTQPIISPVPNPFADRPPRTINHTPASAAAGQGLGRRCLDHEGRAFRRSGQR